MWFTRRFCHVSMLLIFCNINHIIVALNRIHGSISLIPSCCVFNVVFLRNYFDHVWNWWRKGIRVLVTLLLFFHLFISMTPWIWKSYLKFPYVEIHMLGKHSTLDILRKCSILAIKHPRIHPWMGEVRYFWKLYFSVNVEIGHPLRIEKLPLFSTVLNNDSQATMSLPSCNYGV